MPHVKELKQRHLLLDTHVPGLIHGDPADRILIASAYEEDAVLVTADEKILQYGENPFISVFDPTWQANLPDLRPWQNRIFLRRSSGGEQHLALPMDTSDLSSIYRDKKTLPEGRGCFSFVRT
jgi:hypothetical protein